MAITGQLVFKGITLPNAYVQIVRVTGGPKDGGYNCILRAFASLTARTENEQNYLLEKQMNQAAPFVSGADPFDACFSHLSAVDGEFAGFVSC